MLGPTGDIIDKQARLLRAIVDPNEPKVVFALGAIRSGKTISSVLGFLCHSLNYEDTDFIIGGFTLGSLERNVLGYLKDYCRDLGILYKPVGKKSYVFVGANRFHCVGGKDKASAGNVSGSTAGGTYLDEMSKLHKDFVMTCIARASLDGAKVVGTSNPGGVNHWLKEWLESVDHSFHSFKLWDNPYLSRETIDMYYSAFTGHYAKQMLEGEWASPTGLVYPYYKTVPAQNQNDFYMTDISVDWGTSTVTHALATGWNGDHWVVFKEYWHDGANGMRSPEQHADHIVAMLDKPNMVTVDPSAAALKLALTRKGLKVRDGQNDLDIGIQTLSVALMAGKVRIAEDLNYLRKDMGNYYWDEKAIEKGLDVPKKDGNDHGPDALRYETMFRVPLAGNLVPVTKPRGL